MDLENTPSRVDCGGEMSRNADSVYALETIAIHPNESRLFPVDFTGALDEDELLTGTPTVSIDPTGPDLSEQAVNTQATTNGQGQAVVAFKSALVRISGVSAPQNYVLSVTCETTLGNTITVQCPAIGQE